MKNLIKVFGIIALVAVIAFTFAALSLTGCDDGYYGDGYGGGGGNTGTWPSAAILSEFGISGLTRPAGATECRYTTVILDAQQVKSLSIRWDNGSSAHDNAIKSCFINNSWTESSYMDNSGTHVWLYDRNGFRSGMYSRDANDGNGVILVYKHL